MLEVLIPTFQGRIQIRTDGFHTSSTAASGLAPDGVFEFIVAFLAWPFPSPFEMVTQEVEPSSLASVYYRVLVGCSFSPFSSTHCLICSSAF
jgi:hypothetical protein